MTERLFLGIGAFMGSENEEIVAAVLLFHPDGSVLMQHRDDIPGLRHANMWVPPGGHCEPGETPAAGAHREFLEETCYACADLRFLTVFPYPAEDGWKPFRLFVYWDIYDGRQKVECREGQAMEFIARDQASQLLMPGYIVPLWDQGLRAFAHFSDKRAG